MFKKVASIVILSLALTQAVTPQPTKTQRAKKPITLEEIRARNGGKETFVSRHRRKLIKIAAVTAAVLGTLGAYYYWPQSKPEEQPQENLIANLPKDVKKAITVLRKDLLNERSPLTSLQIPKLDKLIRKEIVEKFVLDDDVAKTFLNEFVYPKNQELPAALELMKTLAPKGEPAALLKERQDFLRSEYKEKRETELADVYKNHKSILGYVIQIQRMAEVAGLSPKQRAQRMRDLGYMDVTKRAQPRKLSHQQSTAEYLEGVKVTAPELLKSQKARRERVARWKKEAAAALSPAERERLMEQLVEPSREKIKFKRPVHEMEYHEDVTIRDPELLKRGQDPQVGVEHGYQPVPEESPLVVKGELGSVYNFFKDTLGQTSDQMHQRYVDTIGNLASGTLHPLVAELFIRRYAHKTPGQTIEEIAQLVLDGDVGRILIPRNKAGQLAKDMSNTNHRAYWKSVSYGSHPSFANFIENAVNLLLANTFELYGNEFYTLADIIRVSEELTEAAKEINATS